MNSAVGNGNVTGQIDNESSQAGRPFSSPVRMSSPALTADSSDGDEGMLHSPWSRMLGRGIGDSSLAVDEGTYLQNDEGEEFGDSVIVDDDDIEVLEEEEEIMEEEKDQDLSGRDLGLDMQQGHSDPAGSSQVRRPLRLSSPALTADSSDGDEGMFHSPWSRMMGRSVGDTSLMADEGSFVQNDEEERDEEFGDFVIVDEAGNYLYSDKGLEVEEETVKEGQVQDLSRRYSEPNPKQGCGLPESSIVRRTVSTPAERKASPALTTDSSDGDEMLHSPWSRMMGRGMGDSSLVAEAGSYIQSDEEGREEEREEEDNEDVVAELEEKGQDLPRLSSEVFNRLENRQGLPNLSISMSDIFSSESSQADTEEYREPYDWAWVVAHLVYSRYGEKMRRLRNSIEDRLIHFRSQTNFQSALTLKPELLLEDEVSMLPLLLKT